MMKITKKYQGQVGVTGKQPMWLSTGQGEISLPKDKPCGPECLLWATGQDHSSQKPGIKLENDSK